MSGRNRGRTHTEKMPWWKAVFLDVVFAAAAVGLTFVFVRMWIERRTERTWPVVVGIVRTLEERPGHKGRPVIYLVGEYQTDGGPRRFSVVWDGCDYQDRTWVPPEGTPPVGSKVLLHAAPNDPSRVALDSNPTQDSTASDVIEFAVLLLACIAGAIAVWF